MLSAQTFMQAVKSWDRELSIFICSFVSEIAKQFQRQESDSNEAQSTFSGGFLS